MTIYPPNCRVVEVLRKFVRKSCYPPLFTSTFTSCLSLLLHCLSWRVFFCSSQRVIATCRSVQTIAFVPVANLCMSALMHQQKKKKKRNPGINKSRHRGPLFTLKSSYICAYFQLDIDLSNKQDISDDISQQHSPSDFFFFIKLPD